MNRAGGTRNALCDRLRKSTWEEQRNFLGTLAVVAALLAQLTYTAVLTPPQELGPGCTDLCADPTLSTMAYLSSLVQQSPAISLQYLSKAAKQEAPHPIQLSRTTSAFLVLNGTSLFLALATMCLCVLILLVGQNGVRFIHWVLPFVWGSAFCAFSAFTIAQFTVFHFADDYKHTNAAVWIVFAIAIVTLIVTVMVCVHIAGSGQDAVIQDQPHPEFE